MLSLPFRLLVFYALVLLPGLAFADAPVAWVELGNINVEHGLSVPNSGDGQNEPATVGGSKCRANALESDPPSHCIYFDYDRAAGRPHRPVYVTVEYFDEGFGTFRIQYDSVDTGAPMGGACKDGPSELLLDSRQWRKATFELPDARFDGRQNLDADFRLYCPGRLAVRKVIVEMEHSADLGGQPHAERERVAACVGKLVPPPGVQVVFSGIDPTDAREAPRVLADLRLLAPMMKALGGTSVESYVRWDFVEPSRGKWDWSFYDGIVSILRDNGLKWNPLIMIGPACATPAWFLESKDSVLAVCLEHGTPGTTQTIWNPNLPRWIDRFVAEFAKRYGASGSIESIAIGIGGDFGEAICPIVGDGPTQSIPGNYHVHAGCWCGDEYARADFRRQMEAKYGSVGALNAAWGTNYSSFDGVVPFWPDASHSPRARLDLVKWFRGQMTKWSSYWLETVRNCFPLTDLYLCTAADGQPAPGPDFPAMCKAAAKFRAGVCVAGESSDYGLNFATTRLIAAAGRHYGAHYAFEPAGAVTANGIAARVYNAVTSGARGIHTCHPTVLTQPGGIAAWSSAYRWLGAGLARGPQVAVLSPQTPFLSEWGGLYWSRIMFLRDALDFDLVDEAMIRDGALRRYKALVIIEGNVTERDDIVRILDWVRSGGVVVACDFGGFATVEGNVSLFSEIFDVSGDRSPTIREHGAGLALYVPQGWGTDRNPVVGIARALDSLSTRFGANLVPDRVVDGVYVSDTGRGLLVFNSNGNEVERELQVGIGRRRKAKLPGVSITEVRE